MTNAYRILAYVIAAGVVVQAAVIAFAVFGFSAFIDSGGVADLASFQSGNLSFVGSAGYEMHGTNGVLYLPILCIAFRVVSFFTRSVRGAVTWAAIVLGLVALQVLLGFASHSIVGLGPLHGINAFVLFLCALHAARRVGHRQDAPDQGTAVGSGGATGEIDGR
jgi:heme A synthase